MDREIREIMKALGISRLQAYYHVRHRAAVARSGKTRSINFLK